MLEEIIAAFEKSKKRVGDKLSFKPEVKVKREKDSIYISEIRKTKVNYLAVVEVYHPDRGGDKAPMPLNGLDERSLLALHIRLTV